MQVTFVAIAKAISAVLALVCLLAFEYFVLSLLAISWGLGGWLVLLSGTLIACAFFFPQIKTVWALMSSALVAAGGVLAGTTLMIFNQTLTGSTVVDGKIVAMQPPSLEQHVSSWLPISLSLFLLACCALLLWKKVVFSKATSRSDRPTD